MSGARALRRLLLAVGLLGAASPASAQSTPEESGGSVRVGAAEIVLSGRVQAQLATTSVAGEPPARLFLRRVRLEARIRANDLVGGKIQPDFSGEGPLLRDAFVTLDLSPALGVLVGQTHRPFGLLTRYSSLRMPPVEKGAEIPGREALDELNLLREAGFTGRDVGVHLSGAPPGAPLGLAYTLAVTQGPAAEVVRDRVTLQLVARVAASPWEGVTLGGSWSRRDFAADAAGPDAGRVRAGSAVALDLAVEPPAPGLLLLGEVTWGDRDPWTGSTFRGAQAWIAYDLVPASRAVSMVEPLLRVSRGRVEGGAGHEDGTLVTPGINLYLGGLNRVMLDYDLWVPRGAGSRERSLKAMLQLAF